MKKTCCPMYTIKCAALQFKPSKSQKKILRKFKYFIEKGEVTSNRNNKPVKSEQMDFESVVAEKSTRAESELCLKEPPQGASLDILDCRTATTEASSTIVRIPRGVVASDSSENGEKQVAQSIQPPRPRNGDVPDWAPRGGMKAKAYRRERWRQKLLARGMEVVPRPPRNPEKTLEDRLVTAEGGRHRFEARLVATGSDLFTDTFAESFAVYQKYQVAVHGDSPDKCSASQFKRFLCKVLV